MSENTEKTTGENKGLKDAAAKAMERAEKMAAQLSPENADMSGKEVRDPDTKPEMEWPLPVYPLVARFDVQRVDLEDGQSAIVLAVYTGAGATFGLLSRDGALALSSRLRKVGNGAL